ncbi:MAG: adenylate/guanylate cyclase domain-containing protein [Simkaniaceae bacterium]|nr:adenylate/guanylate cyclase domain-containing protein [Candidatus Sacchlamyda saccharinae]
MRTRLFVWVGVIFLLAFGVSLFFENYLTDKNLTRAENALRKQIFTLNEERRQAVEKFLHVALSEDQAELDSLLLRISRDPDLGPKLFLDPKNLHAVSSANSARLFKNNKWIDFIQSTKGGELTSLLVPIDFPMMLSHEVPIDEISSWIILDDDREIDRPFIGIKEGAIASDLVDVDWGLTVFFNPDALLGFKKTEDTPFQNKVEKVAQYLQTIKEKQGGKDWARQEIKSYKGEIFRGSPYEKGIECLREDGSRLNNHIIELLQRTDQAIMVYAMTSLLPSEAFGNSPFAAIAPKGVARFPEKNLAGHGVLTSEIFFQNKLFNDAAYLKAHPSSKQCEGIGSSLAVITPQNHERVFIGNSLALKGNEGYLTVAIDAEEFVEDLILSTNQSAFLVHGGKVISAFDKEGDKVSGTKIPFTEKMLREKSGTFVCNDQKYYFLHMTPFKNLDLHFYVFQPEKKAFALVHSIEEQSKKAIKSISFNMRIIALFALGLVLLLLHRVARRITKPITQLARATGDVGKGKLEDIELPEVPKGRHDEIATLCASFSEMIKGLQEKEKVKGVLNKVVSPEIAEEIMKGQIHLGGEEKKITVFFADIRNFTHMSLNKAPAEVIEMLNTCMTKIAHEVDNFGGVIDKFVGDEVMALFGAPLEKEDSALNAIQCAQEIIRVLKEWNAEREEPVEMGIGIHTGVVLVGNMGAENRLNYTVIGTNVNLAARMCSTAKGMEILVSSETLKEPHVQESIQVEELPPTELKGFDTSIVLYRVKQEGN